MTILTPERLAEIEARAAVEENDESGSIKEQQARKDRAALIASHAALQAEIERLRHDVERHMQIAADLESANERVCRLRSDEAYQAMLRCPGMQDALLELDQARAAARAALSAFGGWDDAIEQVDEEQRTYYRDNGSEEYHRGYNMALAALRRRFTALRRQATGEGDQPRKVGE